MVEPIIVSKQESIHTQLEADGSVLAWKDSFTHHVWQFRFSMQDGKRVTTYRLIVPDAAFVGHTRVVQLRRKKQPVTVDDLIQFATWFLTDQGE